MEGIDKACIILPDAGNEKRHAFPLWKQTESYKELWLFVAYYISDLWWKQGMFGYSSWEKQAEEESYNSLLWNRWK